MGMESMLQSVGQFGLAVVLVLFFVWQGGKREVRMQASIIAMEKFHRETLVGLTERVIVAIELNAVAVQNLVDISKRCALVNSRIGDQT